MAFDIPDIFPSYVDIAWLEVSQTLISSLIATFLFLVVLILYLRKNKSGEKAKWKRVLDIGIWEIYEFYRDIGWEKVKSTIVFFSVMFFFYVLWLNITWLMGDMIVWVVPAWHSFFRPASTDVLFNALLAIMWVVGSIAYGFRSHGSHFIQKYFPIHGMGIVPKVNSVWTFFAKIGDVVIWLLIGFIELVWELGRILSLSLRLFGNIFVGLILIGLILAATDSLIHLPLITPIIIFGYELCIGVLQAFIFSVLVLVYHRLAAEHDH
jgi:F0F1-type ATP synthase membrane subunit a